MTGKAQGSRRGHYNERVRLAFSEPAHAGDPADGAGVTVVAEVAEGGAGARIRLAGRTDGERWIEIRYRIFGCPHLIAAAEMAAGRFEGGPAAAVREFPVNELIEALGVPIEKTGRILLLEDAFLNLDEKRRSALE